MVPPLQEDDIESAAVKGANNFSQDRSSPEALARKDTSWINCLRILLIATFLCVSIGLSVATYEVLSRLEQQRFRDEFDRIAARITQLFLQDMSLKIWITRMAVYSLQNKSSAGFLSVNNRFLEDLNLAQVITYWERVNWSPLLRTEADRANWEAYTKQAQGASARNNTCYICGEGMEVGNPEGLIEIPGQGSLPCSIVEQGGLGGLISSVDCSYLPLVVGGCQCRKANSHITQTNVTASSVADHLFRIEDGKRITEDEGKAPYSPIGEAMPSVSSEALLYNQMSDPYRRLALMAMVNSKMPTFSHTTYPGGEYEKLVQESLDSPMATIFYPVFAEESNEEVVGSISLDFAWASVFGFSDRLPLNSNGIVLVIESSQGQKFTFEISNQRIASIVSQGDVHDLKFDAMMKESNLDDFMKTIIRSSPKVSKSFPKTSVFYSLRVYPSESFKSNFITNKPVTYTMVVAFTFVFTSAIFIIYEIFVRRRQTKVMESATQADAIVTSLFPESVKIRLMRTAKPQEIADKERRRKASLPLHLAAPKQQLKTMLPGLHRSNVIDDAPFINSHPIADFFPNVTVIFADIAGFTAWSSEREPTQVFQLLESVYHTFDSIAASHGVFKVETIGDCYVAVTGLPEPQDDHAVRMARFAHEILLRMHEMAASLESMLGPGTSSLSIRVGLHSGSVTGGVLRGDKARFQLFGDTMNTAARMQTTGDVSKIQATDATAGLLREAGLCRWVTKRDARVAVKGKGDMQTYWIDPIGVGDVESPLAISEDFQSIKTMRQRHSTSSIDIQVPHYLNEICGGDFNRKGRTEESLERLISWNTDLLEGFLKKVVAGRSATRRRSTRRESSHFGLSSNSKSCPIEDVTEVIVLPSFCEKSADEQMEPELVELPEPVRSQLREYVGRIARMYRDNAFHNFEHASHVAMSASKIVKRIVKPDGIDYHQESLRKKDRKKAVAQQVHHSTFGISSDSLMQFAVIFSAVIHDVDHTGVPNTVLVQEGNELAARYSNKSVAEQRSISIAWDVLMEETFEDLRACIYTSIEEMKRFYQLIVNAVIATDIADSELQMLRKNRWNMAFYDVNRKPLVGDDDRSRKATVVFEYIIQASDVAHTMQHWHVYCKWNERLFQERYVAYLSGREETDPSIGWYNDEIWFFDNYVIPLARKLETCGVFGVSSDEYLNYALENRHEWERKGHDIVARLVEKYSFNCDSGSEREESEEDATTWNENVATTKATAID